MVRGPEFVNQDPGRWMYWGKAYPALARPGNEIAYLRNILEAVLTDHRHNET
ncbi:MAG: hypothetical protein AAF333_10500 [Planctomycetota bacterium]